MLASQTSPSKIFCRQRYSGNTLEAANLSAALTILAQRDEYQMLSPAEMTVCLPATSTPGHSHFMVLKYPLLGPANCLYPTSPLRAFQLAQVTPSQGGLSMCSTPSFGSLN